MDKPNKPFDGYPLFAHDNGTWAKKISGQTCYFGPWNDPDGALERFLLTVAKLTKPDRRRQGVNLSSPTVGELCARFLASRKHKLATGEIVQRSLDDYAKTCERLMERLRAGTPVASLGAHDFETLRKSYEEWSSPHTIGNEVQRVRVIFNFAYQSDLIKMPVKYGPGFRRPSAKTMRIHRATRPAKMLEAHEIRQLLVAAGGRQMKAMILLGVNCALGNMDISCLEWRHVDLESGFLNYARPKTGIDRRCPLWDETRSAISGAAENCSRERRVFYTRQGNPWGRDTADSPLTKEFRKLLDKCKLHKQGVGYYTLRHVFQTIADGSKDGPAVGKIMGHLRPGMGGVYCERIDDDRLVSVANHVWAWLFGDK